ncbi:MAG: cobalamin biosynthesis protein CobD [Firmicutes bacterium]|nr:cobalamin biosynthesis protein CobD [Bacillota bacterium]
MFELSVLCGFLLDLLFADPEKLPHPVVIIGRGISFLEKHLRQIFPDTPRGRRSGGAVLAALIPVTTFIVTASLCILAWIVHPVAFFLLHTLWCWQAVAIRGLAKEAKNVYRCLTEREGQEAPENTDPAWLIASRKAVSRIVGRDTQALDADGVTRAAVETVAENYSDGVIAPYFYMMFGGAVLALTYKSINTMDSMVGYKNEKYIDFGRAAAYLDDVAGYIPARLGALLWICSACMTGQSVKGAWRIWRRDNRNHASPNSAQTESACAGALGIRLAGPAYYFGEFYDKPTIGDALRPIEPEDILRTNRMLYAASILAVLLCMAVSCALMMLTGCP